jgi:hypothetical protein
MKETQESLSASPMWLITYRDCMTLMLVFFLLFMSFTPFNDSDKLQKLQSVFNKQFFPLSQSASEASSGNLAGRIQTSDITAGSQSGNSSGFRDKKVFLVDSAEIFWGDGVMISDNGKKIITIMADFLKQMPNDIIICERPAAVSDKNFHSGTERAWSIIECLCRDKGMNYDRFKISVAGTTALPSSYKQGDRIVEIVLLERSYVN